MRWEFKVQSNSKILVEVRLDKDVKITKDAKFIISSLDILGSNGIIIENGTAKTSVDFQTIQQGQNEKQIASIKR